MLGFEAKTTSTYALPGAAWNLKDQFTEADHRMEVPAGKTIQLKRLYVQLEAALTRAIDVAVRKNAADTALIVSIPIGTLYASITLVTPVTLVGGDFLSIRYQSVGGNAIKENAVIYVDQLSD